MPKGLREPADIRFWRFVQKGDGCWEWQGCTMGEAGYGLFHKDGRSVLAHRFAYELVRGAIPDGLWVLHKCDNRRCVNPDHLFLGDRADNMRDAHQKGRIDMNKVSRAGRLAHYPHLRTNAD